MSYFIVLGVGIYVVLTILKSHPEYSVQALIALLSYAGSAALAAIGFYSWKARGENIFKNFPKATIEQFKELVKEF